MKDNLYLISKAAELSKASPKAIRMYEKMGIIPPTIRTDSGYRLFSMVHIERIKIVKQAQTLGFTLSDISKVFSNNSVECNHIPWDAILRLIDEKINNNSEQIEILKNQNSSLKEFKKSIHNN